MSNSCGNELRYKPQLDGLRTLAVGGVIGHHLWPESWWGHGWLTRWGALGVPLFFVLSGFLITTLLLNARDGSASSANARIGVWWRFGIRRVLRLFPAYYVVILIGLVLGVRAIVELWPWHVTYLTNFWIARHGQWIGPASHFWSLAVEEQFYLVWPVIVLFCPLNKMGCVIGSTLVIGPLFRFWWEGPDVLLLSRVDQLGGGALLAWLAHEQCHDAIERVVQLGRWMLPGVLPVFFAVLVRATHTPQSNASELPARSDLGFGLPRLVCEPRTWWALGQVPGATRYDLPWTLVLLALSHSLARGSVPVPRFRQSSGGGGSRHVWRMVCGPSAAECAGLDAPVSPRGVAFWQAQALFPIRQAPASAGRTRFALHQLRLVLVLFFS